MGVQDNLSALIDSLREESEPTEGKPRITSIRPEKAHQSYSRNMKGGGGTSSEVVMGREPRKMGKKSCVWVLGMQEQE
jgi:hypothetical protein